MTETATDPLVGAELDGRYRILRRLAEGGMGALYEAEQRALGRRVAVKTLHAHLARDPAVVARFRREAMATTAIGHPHIVEVIDLGELPGGVLYLVLELLEGQDLAALLRHAGPLPIGRACRILSQVADGVGAAHAKGVVHRDLKPENVFLLSGRPQPDFVKVVDFGISKIFGEPGGVDSKTRTGTALGTPYYMAPEQAQGLKSVDHRADLYALGVMLFRTLTGHYPFDDESYPMLVVKICTEPPPPVTLWRSDVPRGLEALLERMLSKDPARRPADCAAVRTALAAFTALDGAPALTGAPGPAARLPRLIAAATPEVDIDVHASTHAEASEAATPQLAAASPTAEEATRPTLPADPATPSAATPSVATPSAATPSAATPSTATPSTAMPSTATPAASEPGPTPPDDDDDAPAPPPRRGLLPLAVAALGLLAAAAVGLAVVGNDERPVVDPDAEGVPLPEPGPPVTRPLPRGARGAGWTWRNPIPRGLPTWNAVAVGGPGLVAMAGQDGFAARFLDDRTLVRWRTDTRQTLRGLAWVGADAALAVGDEGTMVRLGASAPVAIDTGATRTLRAVVSRSATEALVVGDGGLVLRVIGDRVAPLDVGLESDLLAAHARGDEVFVVGAGGAILRFTDVRAGRFVRETSGVAATLRAVGGCPDGALYAAGERGTLLRRRPDGTWHGVRPLAELRETLTGVACDRGRAVVSGAEGSVLLASGTRVVRLASGFEEPWNAVAGASDASTWVVGAGGHLATVEVDHVTARIGGPAVPLRDVGAIGGALVAVGEWGRIVREREQGFEVGTSPTDAGLAALAALDEGHLVAVGDLGAVVRVSWEGAELLPSPDASVSYRDVVAGTGGRVLAVGTGGALLSGTPEALSLARLADAPDLWGLAGSPDDAVVVGDAGFAARLTGGRAERLSCAVEGSLRAVVRPPSTLAAGVPLAVGEGGLIVRLEASGCVTEHAGGPTLNAVVIGPDGRPLAVGDAGTALARGDDGTWQPADLEAGSAHLRGAARVDRWVYVLGTGGTLLEHIVADGS